MYVCMYVWMYVCMQVVIRDPWLRVLKSHRSKMSVIYMQSWKPCALLVITTAALWQLMHLGTWYTVGGHKVCMIVRLVGTWCVVDEHKALRYCWFIILGHILDMLSHASPSNIPASVNCFYEYLSTQKKIFSLTRMILEILPIYHFEVLWATLGMLDHT